MQQPPLSSSGSTTLPMRRPGGGAISPTPSDDSDSDISLGTHSPVPSSLSLQHSPGSTSGGGNDRDDRLHIDSDKDGYRGFPLTTFRFDAHSPGIPGNLYRNSLASHLQPLTDDGPLNRFVGAFANRFLPYRLGPAGHSSPPLAGHSPPISGMPSFPVQPTVLRPQPHLPATAATIPSTAATALTGTTNQPGLPSPVPVSPLRIRVNSPSRINSDLAQTHNMSQSITSNGIVRIAAPSGPHLLHRPFSPSPQPKDAS